MNKIIIYQIFTRLFGNRNNNNIVNGSMAENGCAKFNDIDSKTLKRISELGATHIWLTGVVRHATATSYAENGIPDGCSAIVKGKAGSPYAITDYYDVDPDLAVNVDGRMHEFEQLVSRIHHAGLKVITDFVPNHVARQYHSVKKPEGVRDLGEDDDRNMGFSTANNFYYCVGEEFAPSIDKGDYSEFPARATGNDKFDAHPGKNDWYETVKLNYGTDYCDAGGRSVHFDPVPDTWHKMLHILKFWASKGIDGVRCDMAEMVPAEFWKWATGSVREDFPQFMFIGEVYNPSLYREYVASGFDYLYDKVGMYDRVRNIMRGEGDAAEITWQWQNTDDINSHMLYFLENHDEQRIASDFFAGNAEKGIPATIVCALMRSNPFMLYAGQEYGERGMDCEGFSGTDGRTTIFDYWCPSSLYHGYVNRRMLSTAEKALHKQYCNILNVAAKEKAVDEGAFFDLMYANLDNAEFDKRRVYAFLRKCDDELLVVAANFSDQQRSTSIRIPAHAFEFLGLPEGSFNATDILSGSSHEVCLAKDGMIHAEICGNSGVVLKINLPL